eukprot:scaffold30233_cov25-Attheya_sp.AAC.1
MGRWSAICKAEEEIYDRVSAEGTEIVVLKSRDEQCSPGSHSSWVEAPANVSRGLTSKVKERGDSGELKVWAAPLGVKGLPIGELSRDFLESVGWHEVNVPFETPVRNIKIGAILARRVQYGFRPWMGEAIHRVMGHDIRCLVTRVYGSSMYELSN